MKIRKSVIICQTADQVWNIIAHQFNQAHLWMGPIHNSVAIGTGQSRQGAPMEGRLCDLSRNPNGAQAKEIITHFNESEKRLTFNVYPVNNPAIIPIKQNSVEMQVREIDSQRCEVKWIASPQLKTPAYLFYPLLMLIFSGAFGKLLKDLKHYAESNPAQSTLLNE